MQVSRAEFARVKAMARKSRRAEKVAENLALSSQDAPKQDPGGPPRPAKARKARPMSQKLQIKAIKKRILGTGGLWSQAVRRRDRECVMCRKVEGLQAHHWLIRRSHSMALAVDIANGATLCYSRRRLHPCPNRPHVADRG